MIEFEVEYTLELFMKLAGSRKAEYSLCKMLKSCFLNFIKLI